MKILSDIARCANGTIRLNVKIFMEQVTGIGPANYAWEAHILPLNYTCIVPFWAFTFIKKPSVKRDFLNI